MIGLKFDITERIQGDMAARLTRERLGSLTNASEVGVWFCDLPFHELMWDPCVKEHFWLPPDATVTIDTFYERIHPEDRERTRAAIEESIAQKSRYSIDYRTVAPDGRERWIHAIGHAHYDADGRATRFDGVTIDISEHKQADEAIRQQTARFEALFDHAPLGMILIDADFKLRQVNAVARPAFGDIPDLIGRDFDEVMHILWAKDYADEVVRIYRHTLETGEPYFTPQRSEFRQDRNITEDYEWQLNRIPLPDGRNGVVCYFRDVSARVEADQKLQDTQAESERQRRLYETILSNTPDLAYVWDRQHRFTYVNEGLLRMWGKTWDEAIGKNCLELGYAPWHAEMHDREIEQVIATKQPVRGEVPFEGTFGRRIYDYILVPVFDARGNVEAVAGTTRDVTERKEKELRNRFLVGLDDALRPLADPQEITDIAARVLGEHLHVDRCAYAEVEPDQDTMDLTGNYMSRPEIKSLVGQHKFADFGEGLLQQMRENKPYVVNDIDTHEPAIAAGIKEAYRATQIQAVICVPLHKAGRFVASMAVHMAAPRVWTSDEVELVRAVAARCWESIERVRLQRGLRESEESYRTLFESIDEGFCVIEVLFDDAQRPVDYTFLEVNPGFEKQAGMRGVTGRRMREFVTEIEPLWLENYGRVAMTGEPIRFAGEYKGLSRWFDVYAFRVVDSKSRKVAVLFNDITERKQTEIALRVSEERARAASVAKDNFLAQLSHELRTPLTPVLMTAAAMRDDPSVSPAAQEAFAMIERNVTLEARLIDDLLDLTRVTRGKLTLRDEMCDVHSLIGQTLEIVRDEVREKRIALSVDLAAPHRHLRGDPARLQQVFWNLLRNAVNFTPHGGRITILTRDHEPGSDGGDAAGICIEVSDSGIGFDPAQAEHLFEPFYQGKGSRTAGLGLGLAIARALVDMHHGSIEAVSEGVGRGATFMVRLPVSAALSAKVPVDFGARESGGDGSPDPGMRLLVVEDHEATLTVLTNLLSRTGHEITTAGTIAEALRAARVERFDAVVSDLGLPDGTGIELMEQLHSEYGLTGVALSGYGMEEDVRRSKEAGFAAHLVKPVNFEELRRVLRGLAAEAQRQGHKN